MSKERTPKKEMSSRELTRQEFVLFFFDAYAKCEAQVIQDQQEADNFRNLLQSFLNAEMFDMRVRYYMREDGCLGIEALPKDKMGFKPKL